MEEKTHFFDKPSNVKRVIISFFAVCVVLLVLDLLIPRHEHGHFSVEDHPEFFATFGFVACVILVLVSKYVLRKLVKRKEGYYD